MCIWKNRIYYYLWKHDTTLHLTTSMRIHLGGNTSDGLFVEWLLQLGNGKLQSHLEIGMI